MSSGNEFDTSRMTLPQSRFISALRCGAPRITREALHAAKVTFARLMKDVEERGRGFSINQVQNGATESLSIIDLSAPFAPSAPGGCPAGGFTFRVLTSMTTISFTHKASRGLGRGG
jgi:hypothetical protein